MQEGILSLMQMPRTTIAVQTPARGRLPYIVVLTDPTTGGVTASYAMLGDIHIAEPGALICFAGPRVIQQTIREQLPEGFQSAEYLLAHGMIDMVVHRHKLRETLSRVCRLLMAPRDAAAKHDRRKVNGISRHYVNGTPVEAQADRDDGSRESPMASAIEPSPSDRDTRQEQGRELTRYGRRQEPLRAIEAGNRDPRAAAGVHRPYVLEVRACRRATSS